MKNPEQIKKELDEYVIGHEKAKKSLAVAAYNHFKRMNGSKIKKRQCRFNWSQLAVEDLLSFQSG